MDYDGLKELNQLLVDSEATEFREVLPDIPVNALADAFYDWLKDAPDDWDQNYRPMFAALDRLIRGAPDFGLAMAEIGRLQEELAPEEPDDEEEDEEGDEEASDELEEAEPESVEEPQPQKEPAVAAKNAVDKIGPAILDKLREQHPEFAAQVSPETLSKIATEAMGQSLSELDTVVTE